MSEEEIENYWYDHLTAARLILKWTPEEFWKSTPIYYANMIERNADLTSGKKRLPHVRYHDQRPGR